jgi:hypothetical protein
MAREKTHRDVEYAVDDASGRERIFKTPDEAAGFAVSLALSDGQPHHIDVLVHSVEGARWYRGSSDGEKEYEEDPEASAFERIEIRADSQGRVA